MGDHLHGGRLRRPRANYSTSTSNVVAQVILNVPSVCAAGGYGDVITGTPANPFLYGTNGNDLIYALGASYWINGYGGNDCVDAGDGNNLVFDGNGNDGVSAGNGSDTVILGNGDDKVSLGNGRTASKRVTAPTPWRWVTARRARSSSAAATISVTIGTGSYNEVEPRKRDRHRHHSEPGSHDKIDGGAGNETSYLGSGTYNSYSGQPAPHQRLSPADAARLLARDRGGLLPRHHHQLHGGVAMRHARSMNTRRRLIAALTVVGVLALGGAAWAYFTASGSGSGHGSTGTMSMVALSATAGVPRHRSTREEPGT